MKRWNRVAVLSALLSLVVALASAQDDKPTPKAERYSTDPPQLCPVWPIYQISDTEWVYYADHYDNSCNLDDCGYLEGAYLWPSECRDDSCEEEARRSNSGKAETVRSNAKRERSKPFPGHKKPDDKPFPKNSDSAAEVEKKIKTLMPKDPYAQLNSKGEKAYFLSSSEFSARYFSVAKVSVAAKHGDKSIYYGFELHRMPGGTIDFPGVTISPSGPNSWKAKIDVDGDGTFEQVLLLAK